MDTHLRQSNFYQTDIISEASAAMAKTQNDFVHQPLVAKINEAAEPMPEAIGK